MTTEKDKQAWDTPSSNKTPVNIITGFLGVGKTTAIRYLLQTKPKSEKWAVLVNEFGEVGIDGALFSADGIAVKEVTGGCICCSVSVPSSKALRNLIREVKPDRIIIEPTGLALPEQILNVLSNPQLKDELSIDAIICLVDPWCFSDTAILSMHTFQQQLLNSDIIVATKADTASPEHLIAYERYMTRFETNKHGDIISDGQLDYSLLFRPHLNVEKYSPQFEQPNHEIGHSHHSHHSHHYHDNHHEHHAIHSDEEKLCFDADGVAKIENEAEFGYSCGWTFEKTWCFNETKLLTIFEKLSIPRIKGVFKTSEGWIVINKIRQTVSSESIESSKDSRVEMISLNHEEWNDIDSLVRQCRCP